MKNMLIIGAGVIAALLVLYFMLPSDRTSVREVVKNEVQDTTKQDEQTGSVKLKAVTFAGTLEEVNTGCFADGECFVVVDGKHVTVLMGFSQETVGSVTGVNGIGGLEAFIGQEVEVYAQDNSDGTYTLYGSEGFYVKPL